MPDPASHPGFDLQHPAVWRGGLILASPHSGRSYPGWFTAGSALGMRALRSSEDAFVDRLIASATASGAVVLSARVPRAVVDLNRARDDLDPEVVMGVARAPSARARAGLGVIPRVVGRGRVIHGGPMPLHEAQARLDRFWQPYHDRLDRLMAEALVRFGQAVLVDVHSMPHVAVSGLLDPPQLVLGDLWGRSAGGWLRATISEGAQDEGLRLSCNAPFAGAYIIARHGHPARGCHAVQLEIDRDLYMDEARIRPGRGFLRMVASLDRLWRRIAQSCEMQAADGCSNPAWRR